MIQKLLTHPLLKHTPIGALTPNAIKYLFEKINLDIPIDVISLGLDTGRSMMNEKGYKKITELLDDAEFQDTVVSLTNSLPKKEAVEDVLTYREDAVIQCPHCKLAYSIYDAV